MAGASTENLPVLFVQKYNDVIVMPYLKIDSTHKASIRGYVLIRMTKTNVNRKCKILILFQAYGGICDNLFYKWLPKSGKYKI